MVEAKAWILTTIGSMAWLKHIFKGGPKMAMTPKVVTYFFYKNMYPSF
jgi:hypothetical protein